MPLNRFREAFPLGFKESDKIPPGRISLVQAMKLMSDRQSQSAESIDRIADEYKIKPQLASKKKSKSFSLEFLLIMENLGKYS